MLRAVGKSGNAYIYSCVLATALLSSCSKHVAPTAVIKVVPKDTVAVVAALPPGKAVAIDSTSLSAAVTDGATKARQFYRMNSFQTHWLLHNQPSPFFAAFEGLIADAGHYGLRSADYDLNGIQQAVKLLYHDTLDAPARQATLTALDAHISDMFFAFTTHIRRGKITEERSGRGVWKSVQRADNDLDVFMLREAQTADALTSVIAQLQPQQEQYTRLQKALAYYRALEKYAPAPVDVVKGVKVKPDERHAMIPLVRRKLSLTDMKPYAMVYDSATGTFDSLLYDAELASAVKWFQVKHGLDADGIIGERTLRFLNQTFKEKADIIALNMERQRWTREKYGDDYILVNVPAYTLYVYEKQKPALEMRVIVGAVSTPTPIFSDALEHIVFSPTWTVPTSIIKDEILPRLKNNPSYYADKHYEFYKDDVAIDPVLEPWDSAASPYKYRVVQQPGPDNSLGLVKFVMPNNMSVYLHDTPNHRLFRKDYRALSHGCVRLDEPARFATYLLREQKGWDEERIQKAMNALQPSTIILKKKLDVHIEYFTAWVDEQDTVNFREDIYGHDRQQLLQLYPKEKLTEVAGL